MYQLVLRKYLVYHEHEEVSPQFVRFFYVQFLTSFLEQNQMTPNIDTNVSRWKHQPPTYYTVKRLVWRVKPLFLVHSMDQLKCQTLLSRDSWILLIFYKHYCYHVFFFRTNEVALNFVHGCFTYVAAILTFACAWTTDTVTQAWAFWFTQTISARYRAVMTGTLYKYAWKRTFGRLLLGRFVAAILTPACWRTSSICFQTGTSWNTCAIAEARRVGRTFFPFFTAVATFLSIISSNTVGCITISSS